MTKYQEDRDKKSENSYSARAKEIGRHIKTLADEVEEYRNIRRMPPD